MPSDIAETDRISRQLLSELSSLNLRFIELLCLNDEDLPRPCQMPSHLKSRLRGLSLTDRRRLASCPYSLFELDLGNAPRWLKLLSGSSGAVSVPNKMPHAQVQQFALAVVIYTQRLAAENADLGRLLLGINQAVAREFLEVSIGHLMDNVERITQFLTVRLLNEPDFWPDLVNFVKEGTPEQYLAAQTSALQILAAKR